MFKIVVAFFFLLSTQLYGHPCYPPRIVYPVKPCVPYYPPPQVLHVRPIKKPITKKPTVTDSSTEKKVEVPAPSSSKVSVQKRLDIISRDIENLNKMVIELRDSLGLQKHKVPQPLMLRPSEIIGKESDKTVGFPNYKRN